MRLCAVRYGWPPTVTLTQDEDVLAQVVGYDSGHRVGAAVRGG